MSFRIPTAVRATLRPLSRSYASASGASTSNLPLILAGAGILGLGVYVYIDRNPSVKSDLSGKVHEAGHKAQELKDKVGLVRKEQAASGEGAGVITALIKDAWTPFTLTKVEPYNHNTKIYHFTFDDNDKAAGGEVASALLIRSPEGDDEVKDEKGKPVIRPYTPISPPDQKGGLTLMIKEYKDGKLTPFISSLDIGKPLLFKGPIPKYKYSPNTFDRGLCISGGSGITPMKQLISYSLSIPDDRTKWTLIFSNVTEQDILLRKEWDELVQAHPNRLQVRYVLDKPPRGWKGETGFVSKEMIDKAFPREGDKVMAFVCGPPGQVKAVAGPKDGPRQGPLTGALAELNYTSDEVFKF